MSDPRSPQWEDCKTCGGDHWTKDHPTKASSQQMYRTLIHLHFVIHDYYVAHVPGFSSTPVRVPVKDVPDDMRDAEFVFAYVNIGAEDARDLRYERFERAPPLTYFEAVGRPGVCFGCDVKQEDHGPVCER